VVLREVGTVFVCDFVVLLQNVSLDRDDGHEGLACCSRQ
jgi:hypothetical protein